MKCQIKVKQKAGRGTNAKRKAKRKIKRLFGILFARAVIQKTGTQFPLIIYISQ